MIQAPQNDEDNMLNWVKLSKYCEQSGDTPDAVHAKRRKGWWLDGIHWRLAPDGNIWINLEAVNAWVENKPTAHHRAA
jgi:hypothetical protein